MLKLKEEKRKYKSSGNPESLLPDDEQISIENETSNNQSDNTICSDDSEDQAFFHGFLDDGRPQEAKSVQNTCKREQIQSVTGMELHKLQQQNRNSCFFEPEQKQQVKSSSIDDGIFKVPTSPVGRKKVTGDRYMNKSISNAISSLPISPTKPRKYTERTNNSTDSSPKDVYLHKPITLSYEEIFDLYTKDHEKAPFDIEEIEIEIDIEVDKTCTKGI